ncbi:MAG: nitronate monooxygenase [Deltaproteobacteria bacterium]|nr:nitronate monooxygenase [Deltaproteobacteria bacterium]
MRLDDFRLKLGNKEFVPIIIGGMGVDISTPELAVAAARLGGISHISDAESPAVADRKFGTHFVTDKQERFFSERKNKIKLNVHFDLSMLAEAQRLLVRKTMEAKKGAGVIFINCMEKLLMNNPLKTLQTRLLAAMDGGIDGITLSAGLHLRSLHLIKEHPRFRDVKIGIIVSSVRALKIFIHRAKLVKRLPDYIIVEGPLAGGHLGFDIKGWSSCDLKTIVKEVLSFLKTQNLLIPVIAAGGIFTGTDALEMLQLGASGIQVATRFAVTQESGLPATVKQEYFRAHEEDVIVNLVSPTGYPMRMLKQSPALHASTKPNCEALGYLLVGDGTCPYLNAYCEASERNPAGPISVPHKVCLCTHMLGYRVWTCGHNVYRLKKTTHQLPDGTYQLPTVEDVFRDYQFSENHEILLPPNRVADLPSSYTPQAHRNHAL